MRDRALTGFEAHELKHQWKHQRYCKRDLL